MRELSPVNEGKSIEFAARKSGKLSTIRNEKLK